MRKPISCLATSNAEASRRFYSEVMGLRLVEDSPFALVFDDAGQMLRIQKMPGFEPAPYTAHGWEVDDIEACIEELYAKGVEFCRYASLEQSPSGVWISPRGRKVAWFKDPCGNNLSLSEFERAPG